MVPAAKIDTDALRDLMTSQAASPAMVENWVVPTTGLGDKLAGSPTPSDQTGGEKQCILTVTTSIWRLNLEATSHPQRHHNCLSWDSGFGEPLHGSLPLGTL